MIQIIKKNSANHEIIIILILISIFYLFSNTIPDLHVSGYTSQNTKTHGNNGYYYSFPLNDRYCDNNLLIIKSNQFISNNNGQTYNNAGSNLKMLKWKKEINGYGPRRNVIIDDENNLYVSFSMGIVALNQNGTERWNISFNNDEFLWSSPTISKEGHLFLTTVNDTNLLQTQGKIYSFYANGTERWSVMFNQSTYISPAIGPEDTIYIINGPEYVGEGMGELIALFNNGTIKWIFPFEGGLYHTSVSVSDDGVIYFFSAMSRLYAIWPNGTLRWEKNYAHGSTSYKTPVIGNNNTIYCSTGSYIFLLNEFGNEIWSCSTGTYRTSIFGLPTIGTDGSIYYANKEYKGNLESRTDVVVYNPNGSIRWKYVGIEDYDSSIITNDGILIVVAERYLYAFNNDGELIWKFKSENNKFAPYRPALDSSGNVYICTYDNYVYSIGAKSDNYDDEGTQICSYIVSLFIITMVLVCLIYFLLHDTIKEN